MGDGGRAGAAHRVSPAKVSADLPQTGRRMKREGGSGSVLGSLENLSSFLQGMVSCVPWGR